MQEQIAAVQRMQDYIAEHFAEEITLADLARASLFSPWHAHRLFVAYTGLTPAAYIRKLRLSRSAFLLRDGACRVLDVALQMGFGSVDGYQRAFCREFGCNPAAYAGNPVPVYLFTPYRVENLRGERRDPMEKVRTVFVQVVEKPARKVVIKRGRAATEYFAYCEEVGCETWGLLTSMCPTGEEPVSLWLPEAYRLPGTSEYVQGVEMDLDDSRPLPEGLDAIVLPAAKYLLFQGEPFADEDYRQAIGELWEAIPKYDPGRIGYAWDETQPRIQLAPIGARGYVELHPIREK